uniref:Elongation factor Ts, mitochondrial n=1 Tax=Prasinoderma coloniale TaxID=156133 RepID=A0A7R9TXQ0_9VIRI|eukprot:PRCOL_00001585-RA
MMDVKKALEAAGWDEEAAADALRAKGLAKAAKKAGRTAMEGLVGVALSDDAGAAALVEINSETDFVARNERFQILVGRVAAAALAEGTAGDVPARRSAATGSMELDVEALLGRPDGTDGDLKMTVTEVAAACGENVRVRRASLVLAPPGGHVAVYMHNSPAGATALGQMGGAVAVAPGANADEAARIAMHAVAARPAYLNRASVPPEDLERERAVLSEQALASGKPANVVEKMVAGRLNKFYEEHALAEQKLVMDDKMSVKKALGADDALCSFARLQVGEGMSALDEEEA